MPELFRRFASRRIDEDVLEVVVVSVIGTATNGVGAGRV